MTSTANIESATAPPVESSAAPGRGAPGRGAPGPGGGMRGPGHGPHMHCPSGDAPLIESNRRAIERALEDERAAEARYTAIVRALGAVMPFRQLERAEGRHSWALEQLLVQHGVPIPSEGDRPDVPAPNNLRDACATGVEIEQKNIALYDGLMAQELPEDVRCVFSHLREASRARHLPALERCAR